LKQISGGYGFVGSDVWIRLPTNQGLKLKIIASGDEKLDESLNPTSNKSRIETHGWSNRKMRRLWRLNPTSNKSRIETPLQSHEWNWSVLVWIRLPTNQGLKLGFISLIAVNCDQSESDFQQIKDWNRCFERHRMGLEGRLNPTSNKSRIETTKKPL